MGMGNHVNKERVKEVIIAARTGEGDYSTWEKGVDKDFEKILNIATEKINSVRYPQSHVYGEGSLTATVDDEDFTVIYE